VTLTKTRRVEARNTAALRVKHVIQRVQEVEPRFRQYEHTQSWKFFGVRPPKFQLEGCDPAYCQPDIAFGDFVYTEAWVDKLIAAVRDETLYSQIRSFRPPKAAV
jgi:hypothetical protein